MKQTVSIIIPVYNAEKTIRRAVESLLFGANRDVQIILAEDYSRDNSWQICRELSEQYPQVVSIQNETNRGVSYTRNWALNIAQGDYVLFVDSDDWVSKDYIEHLLSAEQKVSSDSMVICGYHFIDKPNNRRNAVIFDLEKSVSEVPVECAFSIMEKVLLQQLWNKIFRRDIIEKHHIRFDETQSMGEDFQFVLDYLEAAQIKKCVVLNEPLYYYIRWNNSSLMSKFGFIDNQPEFGRMTQLARIVGPDAEAHKDEMIAQSKRNHVYHIVRNKNHSKQEKLDAIERIMGDGQASGHYRQQMILYAKEKAAQMLRDAKAVGPRIKGKFRRARLQNQIARIKESVHAEGVTIISQNCIGGVFYHDMGMQFLSPTINTFIPEPGFVKLSLNLRYYMEQELVMRWEEEYPVGMLDDVEVHFMHYATCQEAKSAWERRKQRINYDKILILATDRDGFDDAVYAQWKQLRHPKLLFTAHSEYTKDAIFYPEFEKDGQTGDLIADRSFYRDNKLTERIRNNY